MKTVNVGLLGIGNVGGGAYQILGMNAEKIEKAVGARINVTKILARDKNKKRDGICQELITDDPDDIINASDIDIVVEALGGVEPAVTFMLDAMKAGKHVVTANKAAVAAKYSELVKTAEANNVEFRFEASVGGGIPVLNAISTVLQGNIITEIMGIVNGTTNYILTKMTDYGLPYEEVLKEAQELGFAEADPTADVEGYDVANKLCILMALAFDKFVAPEDIPTVGISKVTAEDIENAKAAGEKIKLIAHARMEDGKLTCSVNPMRLPETHPLAGVNNEFNAVYVTGNAVGELMFYGKGAGALPTGSAVVGDVMEIAKLIKK